MRDRSALVELSFEVPDRLLGHIYIAIGAVLKRGQQSTTAEEEPELHDWGEPRPSRMRPS